MKDQLINIANAIMPGNDSNGKHYKGLSKAAAIREITDTAKLIGTAGKTPKTFVVRLVDKTIHVPNEIDFNSYLTKVQPESLKHLCNLGHVRLEITQDGRIVNENTI